MAATKSKSRKKDKDTTHVEANVLSNNEPHLQVVQRKTNGRYAKHY
jgi:hypothetical protein